MTALLDFAASDTLAGFRLHALEVYNWGTFHEEVYRFSPSGQNALLTGDIGSGKSTLVDAVSTLLVPPQRIAYNKAAGAEARERSLRSYVFGYYKAERGDGGLSAKPVALRDGHHYSVILAHFYNAGFEQHVSLAQVFWIKAPDGPPSRFHVVSGQRLSIAEHFAGFGKDLRSLRKRLRELAETDVEDAFSSYESIFRRRLNIASEQALELFHQTVSMKSVGNLTDFVRQHMLEAFPVSERIDALMRHFDDLTKAHEQVLKAKAQIADLAPLVDDAKRHAGVSAERDTLTQNRNALRAYFAAEKQALLVKRSERLSVEIEHTRLLIAETEASIADDRRARDDVRTAIAQEGGDRLDALRREIATSSVDRDERRKRADRFTELCSSVGRPAPQDARAFLELQRHVDQEIDAVDARRAVVQNDLTESTVAFRELQKALGETNRELVSLRARRSNIESRALRVRERLCNDLGLTEEAVPFAGELLQVRDDARDWEGAIERLLRGFALSLLVPDASYSAIAAWVDRTHLDARLVYLRVRPQRAADVSSDLSAVVRKLLVKADTAYYDWMTTELWRRFDHVCTETLDDFRREHRALTRQGQIKGGNERHEKDDRSHLDDRSRYVLGWSNEQKRAAFEKRVRDLEERIAASGAQVSSMMDAQARLQERYAQLQKLKAFDTFLELDWPAIAVRIAELTEQLAALEAASNTLHALQKELERIEAALSAREMHGAALRARCAQDELKLEQARLMVADCVMLLEQAPEALAQFARLAELRGELLGEHTLTVESCANRESEMRDALQARLDAHGKVLDRLREKVVRAMEAYRTSYPLDTQEVDASLAAVSAFEDMLRRLHSDDLPRFERRFKELLNENTIREVAGFQSELAREQRVIRERIELINRSLGEIEYNPGRYIVLEAEPSPDAEVRDFQQELRACVEGALTGSEDAAYSEAKFLAVKSIIERFRGRDGRTEIDGRWTRKVTDVRNWFAFGVSERWREDNRVHEHYNDSGGKSGGQKEKLAYTVLAASLAYLFGLTRGERRSKTFRFVCIDEAFGRGSEESARYALRLFEELNLQLLVVTPLQKVHVIEPFVRSVGFVFNREGDRSAVRTLTIEEHLAERSARNA